MVQSVPTSWRHPQKNNTSLQFFFAETSVRIPSHCLDLCTVAALLCPSDLQRSWTNPAPSASSDQLEAVPSLWMNYNHWKINSATATGRLFIGNFRSVGRFQLVALRKLAELSINDSPRYSTLQCLKSRASIKFLEKVMWKLAFCPNLHGIPVKGVKKVVLLGKRERRQTWKDFESLETMRVSRSMMLQRSASPWGSSFHLASLANVLLAAAWQSHHCAGMTCCHMVFPCLSY